MFSHLLHCWVWRVAAVVFLLCLSSGCGQFFSAPDVDLIDKNAKHHLSPKAHPNIGQQSPWGHLPVRMQAGIVRLESEIPTSPEGGI